MKIALSWNAYHQIRALTWRANIQIDKSSVQPCRIFAKRRLMAKFLQKFLQMLIGSYYVEGFCTNDNTVRGSGVIADMFQLKTGLVTSAAHSEARAVNNDIYTPQLCIDRCCVLITSFQDLLRNRVIFMIIQTSFHSQKEKCQRKLIQFLLKLHDQIV